MAAKPKKLSNSSQNRTAAGSTAHLNILALLGFMFFFAGAGVFVYQASFAAGTPEPEFVSAIPGQCLDNYQDSSIQNEVVDIYTCNGTHAQRWVIVNTNTVQIHGLCMQPQNDGTAQGTPIVTATCSTSIANQWSFPSNTMVNSASGLCLDDPSPTGVNGTQLVLSKCNASAAQIWTSASWIPPTPTPSPVAPTPVQAAQTSTPLPAKPAAQTSSASPQKAASTSGNSRAAAKTGGAASPSSSPPSSGAQAHAPGAPSNFAATVSGSNAVVELSWINPSGSGFSGVEVDRSVDQVSWSTLASSLTSEGYEDSTVDFSVHYYYRISAMAAASLRSPYVYADATSPSFRSNASGSGNSTYTSDDGLATVSIPTGALSASADCSLNMPTRSEAVPFGKSIVLGPYTIVCKNAASVIVTSFLQPLKWTLNVKGKSIQPSAPSIYAVYPNGHLVHISGSKYDSKIGAVTFQSKTSDAIVALAAASLDLSLGTIGFILMAIAVTAGIVFVLASNKHKRSYNDYLRSKYANARS